MLLAAVAGFNKLDYLYCSISLNGIDWHNFTLGGLSVRNAICCELLSWVSTKKLNYCDFLNMPSWHGKVRIYV